MVRMSRCACSVALVLLFCSGAPHAQEEDEPPVKTYTIERASGPIAIDGKLDEEVWKKAELAHLGDLHDGKPSHHDTTFRMLYDDENLYVAFHCVADHVFSPAEKHDDPVYNGDCVELFLCTGNDPHYYYEIDLSPAEVVWDALIVNTRGLETVSGKDTLNKTPLKEYDCTGLEIKVAINGGKLNKTADGTEKAESWDVEVSIPLTQVPGGKNVPAQSGDEWRGNVYRIDRPPDGKVELQGFSPTITPNFTRVGRFAHLKFK
ncbi:MAG TPA: carbohydrate-binding family 9-like protein [Pirellulales bacterium]|jgi:hypothetical protein|nr:carbohydrate-binding family 9-like protein [Pirellulales bacterium]